MGQKKRYGKLQGGRGSGMGQREIRWDKVR